MIPSIVEDSSTSTGLTNPNWKFLIGKVQGTSPCFSYREVWKSYKVNPGFYLKESDLDYGKLQKGHQGSHVCGTGACSHATTQESRPKHILDQKECQLAGLFWLVVSPYCQLSFLPSAGYRKKTVQKPNIHIPIFLIGHNTICYNFLMFQILSTIALHVFLVFIYIYFALLYLKPRAFPMLCKCSTTKLHSTPVFQFMLHKHIRLLFFSHLEFYR